jgi:hypothetical protein
MAARTNAPANVARASESVPHANPVASSTDVRPGPLDLILAAACFGLGTGLLELVLQNCRWFYDPTTRLGDHLVNRHYLWMIPVANVLVFGSCGLMLALAARIWPYAVGRLAAYLLWGLASLELLLVLPRLHTLTYLLLACGFASLIAPFFEARSRQVSLYARRDSRRSERAPDRAGHSACRRLEPVRLPPRHLTQPGAAGPQRCQI